MNSPALADMDLFYSTKAKCRTWAADMEWLSGDWASVVNVELLRCEVGAEGLGDDDLRLRHQQIADEVHYSIRESALHTMFNLKLTKGWITLEDVIGNLARNHMLTDAVIDYSVRYICRERKDCFLVSSLAVSGSSWPKPTESIAAFRFIIMPAHIGGHWGVIIAEMEFSVDGSRVTVHQYESLIQAHYGRRLEAMWTDGLLPFMRRWYERCEEQLPFPSEIERVVIEQPDQPDGVSCGVMVVGMVASFLSDTSEFRDDDVTLEYVRIMRLRLMWAVLCDSTRGELSKDEGEAVRETYKKLVVHFKDA
jgi:hypothetical protein